MTAADLLPSLLADDPAAPRITCYDDLPGPTRGERIELSGRVLANWVAKAANALTSDFDIQPGDVVALALPPHWRTVYWALAGWAVGASVHVADPALGSDDPTLAIASVVVTDSVELAEAADAAIVVTLAALARSHPGALPSHAMDEAAELASYPDRRAFAAPEVDPARPALITPGRAVRYDELVAAPTSPGAGSDSPGTGERILVAGAPDRTAALLEVAASVWAGAGSVVLVRTADGAAPEDWPDRFAPEQADRALLLEA